MDWFLCADKVFLQHLVELKAQVRLNTQMLQSLSKLVQDLISVAGKGGLEGASSTAATLPTGVSLPLKSLPQLQRVEKMLRTTPVERQKLVCATVWFIFMYHQLVYGNSELEILDTEDRTDSLEDTYNTL